MLKRIIVLFISLIIAIVICATTALAAEPSSDNTLIRVGLSYSTSATNKVTVSNSGGFFDVLLANAVFTPY